MVESVTIRCFGGAVIQRSVAVPRRWYRRMRTARARVPAAPEVEIRPYHEVFCKVQSANTELSGGRGAAAAAARRPTQRPQPPQADVLGRSRAPGVAELMVSPPVGVGPSKRPNHENRQKGLKVGHHAAGTAVPRHKNARPRPAVDAGDRIRPIGAAVRGPPGRSAQGGGWPL